MKKQLFKTFITKNIYYHIRCHDEKDKSLKRYKSSEPKTFYDFMTCTSQIVQVTVQPGIQNLLVPTQLGLGITQAIHCEVIHVSTVYYAVCFPQTVYCST